MLALENLIDIFYSTSSADERDILLVNCTENAREYYPDTWAKVDKIDLATDKVKLDLVYTFYQLQLGGCEGVATSIIKSFHQWSDGTINFDFLSLEDNNFYEDYYLFVAVYNFENSDIFKQIFLLETRFLVRALIRKLPLLQHIKINFASYNSVEALKADAILLSEAMSRNITPLDFEATSKQSEKNVANWIKDFNEFKTAGDNKLEVFLGQYFEGKNIEFGNMELLARILDLYQQLSSESIWKDLDYSLFPYEPLDKGGYVIDENSSYLKSLSDLSKLDVWLRDYTDLATWLAKKDLEFIHQVLGVLKEKIDLNNQEELMNTLSLLESLSNNGVKLKDDILYFDENSGKFIWNKDIKL